MTTRSGLPYMFEILLTINESKKMAFLKPEAGPSFNSDNYSAKLCLKKDDWPKAYAGPRLPTLPYRISSKRQTMVVN